jgi:hypothetical protein
MQTNRYPKIHILSKNELAKHISHNNPTKERAIKLINDVLNNYDQYWKDNKIKSEPLKNKYVRNAKGTPLGKLLDKINKKVLAPHDNLLPNFIFGGVSGMNHKIAGKYLLGSKRKRTLLKMDIFRFFEQISSDRVYFFFKNKCQCSARAAKLISNLCCVPIGPKGNSSQYKTVARGFATSSRLAVWCNLDIFIKLNRLIIKRLKTHDPRIAIYVDDIGITASRVSKDKMNNLLLEAERLLLTDKNQKLPLNKRKCDVISYKEKRMEHLGLTLYKNKLSIGAKTKSKLDKAKNKAKNNIPYADKIKSQKKYRSLVQYKKYIEI